MRRMHIVSFVVTAVALLSVSVIPAAAAAYDQPPFTYDEAFNTGARVAHVVDAPTTSAVPNVGVGDDKISQIHDYIIRGQRIYLLVDTCI